MKNKNDRKWTTSRDFIGERYDGDIFNTKEEAIADLKSEIEKGLYEELKEQGYFWVGQIIEYSTERFFDTDQVLDMAWELAQDEGGEFAEDYLQDVSQEQKNELQDLLNGWVKKHDLYPNFFQIINLEKVVVEAQKNFNKNQEEGK